MKLFKILKKLRAVSVDIFETSTPFSLDQDPEILGEFPMAPYDDNLKFCEISSSDSDHVGIKLSTLSSVWPSWLRDIKENRWPRGTNKYQDTCGRQLFTITSAMLENGDLDATGKSYCFLSVGEGVWVLWTWYPPVVGDLGPQSPLIYDYSHSIISASVIKMEGGKLYKIKTQECLHSFMLSPKRAPWFFPEVEWNPARGVAPRGGSLLQLGYSYNQGNFSMCNYWPLNIPGLMNVVNAIDDPINPPVFKPIVTPSDSRVAP
jgi:hypothetical protein